MFSDARDAGRTEERRGRREFTRIYSEWAGECHRRAAGAFREGAAVPPPRDLVPLLRDLLDCFSPGDRSFVSRALTDPYFPVTMTSRTHLRLDPTRFPFASPEKLEQVKMDRVAGLSRIFLRIRRDIANMEAHGRVSSHPPHRKNGSGFAMGPMVHILRRVLPHHRRCARSTAGHCLPRPLARFDRRRHLDSPRVLRVPVRILRPGSLFLFHPRSQTSRLPTIRKRTLPFRSPRKGRRRRRGGDFLVNGKNLFWEKRFFPNRFPKNFLLLQQLTSTSAQDG